MIAGYTRQIMADLDRNGQVTVPFGRWLTQAAARSRIQNAAGRLGLYVETHREGNFIHGTVWGW